jgi:protease PrsW
MVLFALAIAPGIAICWFIYFKDKYQKENIGAILKAFFWGILSVLPAIFIQLYCGKFFQVNSFSNFFENAFFAYAIVALSEEGSKFLMLRLFVYPKHYFDDPFDGIVYAVMIGMGFATLENIGYVYQHGFGTGILRMFLSVPAHGTFAVLMGYFVGLAKFNNSNKFVYFFQAIFWPIFFHGTFDLFLFLGSTPLHFGGAVLSFVIAIYFSKKAIQKKQLIAKMYHDKITASNQSEAL